MEEFNPCYAISPLDGRYSKDTKELQLIASEFGLMKARVIVEVEYLITLISELSKKRAVKRCFSKEETRRLRDLYNKFSTADFERIKEIENKTNHDVKAVEYFLKEKIDELGLNEYVRFVHFGRTSEDINNVAYAFMLGALVAVTKVNYMRVVLVMEEFAKKGRNIPMLALTHGQPATGTTVEWTIGVYCERVKKWISSLDDFEVSVKFGGATGANNAMCVAYPQIDWRAFNFNFINSLQNLQLVEIEGIGTNPHMEVNHFTFQIDPHDTYKKLFDIVSGANTVLIDFCQNVWEYISREIFVQKFTEGEVGSSAMPQKINPIKFENAEGNLKLANAILGFLSTILPVSRGYRDLTDSTLERNFGSAFGYILISLKSILKGMAKIRINENFARRELNEHWQIISEAYQVILKRAGVDEGYEIIAKEIKGKPVSKEILHDLIDKLKVTHNLSDEIVFELKAITPENYLGNRSFEF